MAERLYYDDSFLTSFDARVTDIRLVSRTAEETLWQVALDRTAFYPTSGGQPFDLGSLVAESRSGAVLEAPVTAVEEDEHGEVWHTTTKPLAAGTGVRGLVDWPRRLDHMQQHSAQHLLSAVCARELQAPTVSFHLGAESSTIDLAMPREDSALFPPEVELERVERTVNQLIAEDLAVCPRTVERAEAEQMLASGALRKLPDREGAMRLVEIAKVELNACGGTHVRSTGQIGGLLLRSTERVKQGLRVEFVAGLRAVSAARRDFGLLTQTSASLSIAPGQVPEAVARLLADAKSAAKERQKLREELAQHHAIQLVIEDTIVDHLRVVRRAMPDRDAEYVKLLASRVAATKPQTLALLASTQADPATVAMARSGDLDFSSGALLKQVLTELGVRGGGSPALAQGQVPLEAVDAVFNALEAAVRGQLTGASPSKS